jgi:hypothetical protein
LQDDVNDLTDEFVDRLNKISADNWVSVMTAIKPKLVPGMDPKSWPTYQKLILRIIQDDEEYYSSSNFEVSPDGVIFKSLIESKFDAWLETKNLDPEEFDLEAAASLKLIRSWAREAKETVDRLFRESGIPAIENVSVERAAIIFIESRLGLS